jgi:hypothetical protein
MPGLPKKNVQYCTPTGRADNALKSLISNDRENSRTGG